MPSETEDGVPKVLARNFACHQCRKRKLKCDAIRPRCTNCSKPRVRGRDTGSQANSGDTECTWDEPREPSARTRRRKEAANRDSQDDSGDEGVGAKRVKLGELEERIAAFEKVLQTQREQAQLSTEAPRPSELTRSVPYLSDGIPQQLPPFVMAENQVQPMFPGNTGPSHMSLSDLIEAATDPLPPFEGKWSSVDAAQGSFAADPNNAGLDFGTFNGTEVENIFDLIWPDWPKDLPTFEVVEHVANVFFDKVPTYPKMIHRATFFQSLQYPPRHPEFPCRSLLHAILAITANHIAPTLLGTRAYFPVGASWNDITHPEYDLEPRSVMSRQLYTGSLHTSGKTAVSSVTPFGRYQLWHRRKALESMTEYLDRGDRFLQCVQAQVLVAGLDHFNAWWTDAWMESGACIRMATPIRINESPNVHPDRLERHTYIMLPSATSAIVQAERDRTWWMCYLVERACTLSTTWPSTLADDEITVELPTLQSTFDSGFGQLGGTQTINSPDLFTFNPPHHADGFVFFIKALKLFTDVNIFFRRYTRGPHSVSKYVQDPNLRLLLSQINSFRMSFPQNMRRPTQNLGDSGTLDRDLVTAITIAHAAMSSLGEPLITKDTWTNDISRLSLTAIRAILSLLYDITATSFDLSLLPPVIAFIWGLCAKILCRFLEAANQSGDPVSASVFRSEIEVFRLALSQYSERFPMGQRQLKMVDDLIKAIHSGEAFSSNYIMNSAQYVGVFDEEYHPSKHAQSLGSTLGSTPITAPESMTATDGTAGKVGQSPAIMDMFNDPSFDISSFSFDVEGVAELFANVGGGMDATLRSGLDGWK